MRQPRIRPDDVDTIMHVYNRICGTPGEYPFGSADKQYFINLMHRLTRLFTLEIIAYQLMGNHFHLLVYIPSARLSLDEAVKRFNDFYHGKRVFGPDSPAAQTLPEELRDISRFMHALEQGFTRWFNRTRTPRRRGYLWGSRFKNTILEQGLPVWQAWLYIELNAVRARLARRAEDYRFGSFGVWSAKGKHPSEATVRKHVLPFLPMELGIQDLAGLWKALHRSLGMEAAAVFHQPVVIEQAGRSAEKEPFSTRVDRRVRYWVDGLVIGSDIFVKTVVARARGEAAVARRRLVRAMGRDPDMEATSPPLLFCFKQLRHLV